MDSRDYIIKAYEYLFAKKKECKHKDVAAFIPVNPPQLSQFLGKSRNFSEKKRERLAEFFDTTYMDMLFLNDEENYLTQ